MKLFCESGLGGLERDSATWAYNRCLKQTMQTVASNLICTFVVAGLISTVLCTSCVSKDVVHDAVEVEKPSPGLIAFQKGRSILAKRRHCYRGEPPPSPPGISVLIAKDKISIGLNFGSSWQFPYKQDPNDRLWKILSVDGEYDWQSAKERLLEVRGLLHKNNAEMESTELANNETITTAVESQLAENNELAPIRKSGILEPAAAEFHTIEIAAEPEVRYAAILSAMDLAVATQFTEIEYTEPSSLRSGR